MLAKLLGTGSFLTMAQILAADAQPMNAQASAAEVPEQLLITGSLIRGAAAVGVPVTNLSPQDFVQTGALTTAELFKTVPAALVTPTTSATQTGARIERASRVNLRNLDLPGGTRSLLMVDGMRVPAQGTGLCEIDPSIVPAIALDRIDVLVNGASATYGSDAIVGVINIILKRGYDGAVSQMRVTNAAGRNEYLASQLWGRTWDGGDITLSYEWYDVSPVLGKSLSNFTLNHSPWGLDNRIPLASSIPGTVSTGAPSATLGTGCTNCLAIPRGTGRNFDPGVTGIGPTAPFSASTLSWAGGANPLNIAANTGSNGTRNELNPYLISYFDAAQQRNAGTLTIDQRLTRDISFYGEAFYSNRRSKFLNPSNLNPGSNNDLSVAVPTSNPYYPSNGAPTNLRVNYNLGLENPSVTNAYELTDRYQVGLHFALPFGWNGDLYFAETNDGNFHHVTGTTNRNAVSAALGWTIAATPAQNVAPAIATWTKPTTVPYLNLFCDATEFQCNSPATLAYVSGVRQFDERYWINEKGLKFDGPLFDLPAGTIKAAVGGSYTSSRISFIGFDSTSSPTLLVPILSDPQGRQVWAGFAEVNVPVFDNAFNLPLFRKLQIAASWRHDQYSDIGSGTSNSKVSFDWMPLEQAGLTFRGSWGSNFRAPSFGETSSLAKFTTNLFNANDIQAQTSSVLITSATPDANNRGSGAERLFNPSDTNSIPGLVGFNNNGASITNAGPPGLAVLSSQQLAANSFHFRDFVNQHGQQISPETAINYNFGAEFAPTAFLKGLDVQATYYSIKISNLLSQFAQPQSNSFNTGFLGFSFIVPTDLAYLHPASQQCHNNNTPGAAAPGGVAGSGASGCPEFEQMILNVFANGRNSVPASALTRILWINDGGIFNEGSLKADGIDWAVSYDMDLGDWGAWNTGIVGTYYLHRTSTFPVNTLFPGNTQPAFGGTTSDDFHTDLANLGNVAQNGVTTDNQMVYRARLGWSSDSWSVTGFVNYSSHFFHTQQSPPNVNGQCISAGSNIGGGTFPCAIEGYTNIEPSFYTFDLSLGYNTGDMPKNEYLRNIGVQVVIQNLLGRKPPYGYRVSSGGASAYDVSRNDLGRIVSVSLTKTW
jgi:outer membrane receptor protein involved in Fe transport